MPDLAAFRDLVAEAAASPVGDAPALWSRLGAAGVLRGVYRTSPDRLLDPDPARLGALLTKLDAAVPLGVVLSVCVPVATVIPLLAEEGRHTPLADKVADSALSGESVVALAVTDSAAPGSDVIDAGTEVEIGDTEITLRGSKDWITNATQCDHLLVLARHDEARHFSSFSWVLAPANSESVSVRPATGLFAGSGIGHLRFDGLTLGREHLIGRPGRALAGFARRIGTERLAGALWAQALCRRVLTDTRRWLVARTAGGRTQWDNPAIRQRFGRCLVELHRLDALCALRGGRPDPAEGMVLKAAVGVSVEQILGECADLRGADSFRDGGEAGLRTEAAMFGIAGGATGAMLAGIADHADVLLRGFR